MDPQDKLPSFCWPHAGVKKRLIAVRQALLGSLLAMGLLQVVVAEEQVAMPGEMTSEARGVISAYEAGVAALQRGAPEEAERFFRTAVRLAGDPPPPQVRSVVAASFNNMGNLHLLWQSPADAETHYRAAIAWDESNDLAVNNLGAALLRQGRIQEAQDAFERTLRLNPRSTMAMNNLAEMMVAAGDGSEAVSLLERSIRADPANPQSLRLLVRIYEAAGMRSERNEAIAALEAVSGDSLEARLGLSAYYFQHGLLDAAGVLVADLLEQHRQDARVRLQAARLRALHGDLDGAIGALRELLGRQPELRAARSDLVEVLVQARQLEEAWTLADESVRRHPEDADFWYARGVCADHTGRLTESERSYRQALELNPRHVRAANNLGIVRAVRDDGEGALAAFERAVAMDPFFADAQYNLGRSLVVTRHDYSRGIRLLGAVAKWPGPAGLRARQYLDELMRAVQADTDAPDAPPSEREGVTQ